MRQKKQRKQDAPPPNFEFEFDAKNIHPSNVDALAFLEYAAAYIEGLSLVARLQDGDLAFSGVEIVDKCVMLRSRVSNSDLGWTAVTALDNFVAGTVEPPRKLGLNAKTKALVGARDRLLSSIPPDARKLARSIVRMDSRTHELRAPPGPASAAFRYRSIETVRARVERLIGAELKARLNPVFGSPFIVDLTEAQALEVRHYWLDEVDVDVEVDVEIGGGIVKGRLLRFHPLAESNGIAAWRDWVEPNGDEK
jgi:hypothetical protein